ncbi:hypothetical protein Dimus_002025 [Dionaea muscipula]
MKITEEIITLPRSSTSSSSTAAIITSSSNCYLVRSTSAYNSINAAGAGADSSSSPGSLSRFFTATTNIFSTFVRSLLSTVIQLPVPTCCWRLRIPIPHTPASTRKVTGTLFGLRNGHVSFAVQLDPRAEPVLLLQLGTSTASLVREMSSGLVRIVLECEKGGGGGRGRLHRDAAATGKLFQEPVWSMYCNGRKSGYAVSRTCGELDWFVLSTVQSVSVGAGVIPLVEGGNGGGESNLGELLYMRATFDRVVGSRDSEAFYMLNPDGNCGPELSIFLLRL